MQNFLVASLLGIIQGITEFLPISSTAHLIIFEKIFHISQEKFGLSFDAALHLGTFFSLLIFFRQEIIAYIKAFLKSIIHFKIITQNEKISWIIIVATIPAVLTGFFFEDKVEHYLRSPMIIVVSLCIFSLYFLISEKLSKLTRNLQNLNFKDGLIIGISQAIAFIPGTSRSGITISTALTRNYDKQTAAKFAFLLSLPITLGAGGKKLVESVFTFRNQELLSSDMTFFAVGIAFSAITGFFVIKYFLEYFKRGTFVPFVIYRIMLAGIILWRFW